MVVNGNVSKEILDRIQKVLALASNNPSKGESAAAAAKAQELLHEYNLEMADVIAHDPDGEKVEWSNAQTYFANGGFKSNAARNWRYRVASSVAKPYHCSLVLLGGGGGFAFIGRSHNALVATEVTNWIIEQMVVSCIASGKELGKRLSKGMPSWEFRESFYTGCNDVLERRLLDQYLAQKKAAETDSSALAIYNDSSLVRQKVREFYPRLGKGRNIDGKRRDAAAAKAGRKAGEGMNLNSQRKVSAGQKGLSGS